MLNVGQRRNFYCKWCSIAKEKGKWLVAGQLKCWEAEQVISLEGPNKALGILEEARAYLDKAKPLVSKESFEVEESLYLYVRGEILKELEEFEDALEVLEQSLKIMRSVFGKHSLTARTMNAIGNCLQCLERYEEAQEYYCKTKEMLEELTGSEKHFDMPVYYNQLATIHEVKGCKFKYSSKTKTKAILEQANKEFETCISWYQKALKLEADLGIQGYGNTARYYRNMANTFMHLEKYDEALNCASKALKIRKELFKKHPDILKSLFQVGIALEWKAQVSNKDSKLLKEALTYYEEAKKMLQNLPEDNRGTQELQQLIEERCKVLPKTLRDYEQKKWTSKREEKPLKAESDAKPHQAFLQLNDSEPHQATLQGSDTEPHQATLQENDAEPHQATPQGNDAKSHQATLQGNDAEPHQATLQGNDAEPRQATLQGNDAEPHQATPQGNDVQNRECLKQEQICHPSFVGTGKIEVMCLWMDDQSGYVDLYQFSGRYPLSQMKTFKPRKDVQELCSFDAIPYNPVEYYGILLDDRRLHDFPLEDLLPSLVLCVPDEVFDELEKRKKNPEMFFSRLLQLTDEQQEKCFKAIISALEKLKNDGKGVQHCLELLRLGEKKVRSPVNQAVTQFVSRRVREGWRELGRELRVKDAVISSIEEEVIAVRHKDPLYEGCYQMLLRWKESFGKDATVKALITKLTKCHSGYIARVLIEKLSIDDNGELIVTS